MSDFDVILLMAACLIPWGIGMVVIFSVAADVLTLGFAAWWVKRASR